MTGKANLMIQKRFRSKCQHDLVPHFTLFFALRASQTRHGKAPRAGNSLLYCQVL